MTSLRIFSDGGARGNPGPAAIAFLVLDEKAMKIAEHAYYIGKHTNNQAEYEALIMALKFAETQNPQEVVCHLDSELVAKQVTGEYAVKNPQLKKLWSDVQILKRSFKKISFVYVPRENSQIARADALVNMVLDEHAALR
jgi:ribonuclease HI